MINTLVRPSPITSPFFAFEDQLITVYPLSLRSEASLVDETVRHDGRRFKFRLVLDLIVPDGFELANIRGRDLI